MLERKPKVSTKVRGRVIDGILHKNARQAKKFFKYNGYGIKRADLHNVQGVVIDTQYDGKLYAAVSTLEQHGVEHMYGEEKQLILPVNHWRGVK